MNQQEIFQTSEAIARGDNCPACGATWQPDPEGRVHQIMDHAPDCPYILATP